LVIKKYMVYLCECMSYNKRYVKSTKIYIDNGIMVRETGIPLNSVYDITAPVNIFDKLIYTF
jgi:hypothetical protein